MMICSHWRLIVVLQVMGAVDVKHTGEHELMLEWESSASNDMVADSTLALITGIDQSPASVKCPDCPIATKFLTDIFCFIQ